MIPPTTAALNSMPITFSGADAFKAFCQLITAAIAYTYVAGRITGMLAYGLRDRWREQRAGQPSDSIDASLNLEELLEELGALPIEATPAPAPVPASGSRRRRRKSRAAT